MPKVSLVMPSLNVAPYIRACMDSVISQTLKDIEILCVDAGSTDGTLEILREYEKRDPRVRVLLSDKKSYGYQMNLGLDAATGDYFGIVETDDYVAPEMFRELYAVAEALRLDIVKGDYAFFIGDGAERRFKPFHIAKNPARYLRVLRPTRDLDAFRDILHTWAGLYRTGFLKENGIRHNETPGASFQDNGFWFQTYALARRLLYVPKVYYYLRRDNAGSSTFSRSKVYCECVEFDFIRDWLRRYPNLEPRLAPIVAYRRSGNYYATLERIADEDKHAFLKRFQADFQKIEADGELDPALFSPREWRNLRSIMDEPESYFRLEREGELEEKALNRLQGGLWCVRDHGLAYTLRYMLSKRGESNGL